MSYVEEALTTRIIECIIKVHQVLGPGFLETIYKRALLIELRNVGLFAEAEKEVLIFYCDEVVGKHRLDLFIEKKIVLELKNVELLHGSHYAQVKSYLRASGSKVGLLVNFASKKADFRRIELL